MNTPSINPYSIVIPTLARPSLTACLAALAASEGPDPERVVLVDDRPGDGPEPLVPPELEPLTEIVRSGGGGPAAARNLGWRRTSTGWVVFLDDDVAVSRNWKAALAAELAAVPDRVAGIQGRIIVPLPSFRPPTDWERNTAGLETACWITADMAYRRAALVECGGFDERFPRAFREDADLALRVLADGWELQPGQRRTTHPVRPSSPWISLRQQAGNADDALMTAVHGKGWYARAGASTGRRARHLAITTAGIAAAGFGLLGRWRTVWAAGTLALAGVSEFALARIKPGPRTPKEIGTMAVTSLAIPPAAVWHWARGALTARGARAWPGPAKAILFDRDGTLIHDVPYNGDPSLVEPMPGAREALELARRHGLRVGVVSNQSGLARGLFGADDLKAVQHRVEELLGPFGTWQVCPHGEDDGCACRKPAPGLITAAAVELGVPPEECVVIGDIGSDAEAARAAGARSILVPTEKTLTAELEGVRTAPDLRSAVRFALADVPGAVLWR